MGCLRLTYCKIEPTLKVAYKNLKISNKSCAEFYRYGFQAQESDDEVKGDGNSVNYKYRMHDPRLGRFFAVDPLAPKYPHNSPYAFSENKVIAWGELEGLESYYTADGTKLGQVGDNSIVRVVNADYVKNAKIAIAWANSGEFMSQDFNNALLDNSANLKIEEDEYHRLAGVLYAEGSSTVEEARAIYSTLENRATVRGHSVSAEASTANGVYGAGTEEVKKIQSPNADKKMVTNAYKGLYQGITSSTDFSNGAYFWDGKDFNGDNSVHGGYDERYLAGFKFTNPAHDLWGQGNKKKMFQYTTASNGNTATAFYKYESTAAFGNTSFSKLTYQWRDSQLDDSKSSDGTVTKRICGPLGTSQGKVTTVTKQ